MTRTTILFLTVICFGCSNPKTSNTNMTNKDSVFVWSEGMCEMTGTFNPSQYTVEELNNTWSLTSGGSSLGDVINYFDSESFQPPGFDTINAQYNRTLTNLKELKLVTRGSKYWEQLRQQRILELEDEYKLKKITIEAYQNPSILLKNDFTDSCLLYASALASTDTSTIFSAWRQLHSEQLKHNGAPDVLEKKFQDMFDSPDKLKYAKSALMGIGWWNCANHQILHIENDGKMAEEFAKLFLKVQTECDEE
ncbi:MAG: hypothetical protein V4608_17310 [Bacteroidota bacterium]